MLYLQGIGVIISWNSQSDLEGHTRSLAVILYR